METNHRERPETEAERTVIWFLITELYIGGAELTLVELVNDLDPDAYDVTIWTIFPTTPLESELRPGVTVRSLTADCRPDSDAMTGVTDPRAFVTAPARFCYAAYVERPDLIQSFLFFDNLIARAAGIACSAPIITGVRVVSDDQSRLKRLLDRVTSPLSDVVVSNSEAGAEQAIERGVPEERVLVIRNGRDVESYRDASPESVRAELDLAADTPVVGTVGRLVERKGHFELISAWATLQRDYPEARLLLVGYGPDRSALERHAEQLGCDESIHFLGRRRDVPSLLAAMDVFAFPSHFEGLPGAVIEAMAAGLPIVATPVDGTAELLENYRTGLFVSVEAPDEVAWALRRCLEHPALRSSLGDAAQRRATERFAVETMVERFEQLYRRLDGGADRRVPVRRREAAR